MMGDEFGGPVPVGPFRLIGSEAIGEGVVETLKKYPKSPAVLMQNHGPFTIGKDAESAVKAAAMPPRAMAAKARRERSATSPTDVSRASSVPTRSMAAA